MLRWLFVLTLITLVSGCGTKTSSQLDEPDDSGQVQINVDPNEDIVKSVGDITVTIPAGTFAAPGSIVVSRRVASDLPSFDDFEPVSSESEITISAPNQEISGDIVIDLPSEALLSSGRASVVTAIYGLFSKLSDGRWSMISKLPQTEAEYLKQGAKIIIDRAAFSDFGKKITGVIGKFGWAKPEIAPGLVLVYANPTMTDGHDLILVHGWNATSHVFDRLVGAVVATGRYANVYVYEYNWCDFIENSGGYLAHQIKVLASQGRRMDVWAHSMGALVSRYALEYFKATKNVRTFVSICGANEGSVLGKVSDIMSYLRTDYLNKPESACAGLYFPAFDTYSTAQLVPNSALLRKLNIAASNIQLGNVNYVLISGRSWTDLVVGEESALAGKVDLRSITLGTISRISTLHDHDGLIDTDGGIKELIGLAAPVASTQLIVNIKPSIKIEATANDVEWSWTMSLWNRGNSEILVKGITFDQYDSYGDWLCVSWYSPDDSEKTFPITPLDCDIRIAPGGTENLDLCLLASQDRSLTISQLSEHLRSRTFLICARFQDRAGNDFKVNRTLVLTIPGVATSAAKTRMRGIAPIKSLARLSRR